MDKENSTNKAMRIFLHEIKNPITALMFQSENLKETLPKEYLPDMEAMDKEIQRLSDLVKGASEYVKNPKGNPEIINASESLKMITNLFEKNIKLSCPANISVVFDKDRFRSVFENLIKNAFESNDGKDARVEVEVSSQQDSVVIRVLDNGSGLDSKAASKIFDFGYTTKDGGSGIGLFLVKQFVEAQNGTVKLYPKENNGTVAEVVLPCN